MKNFLVYLKYIGKIYIWTGQAFQLVEGVVESNLHNSPEIRKYLIREKDGEEQFQVSDYRNALNKWTEFAIGRNFVDFCIVEI